MVLKLLLRNCAASSSSTSTSSRSKRLTSLSCTPWHIVAYPGISWHILLLHRSTMTIQFNIDRAKSRERQLPSIHFFSISPALFSTIDISFILWVVHFGQYDYVKMNFLTLSRYLCFRQFVNFQSTWLLNLRANKCVKIAIKYIFITG